MLPQLFVAIMEAVYAIFIDVIVLKNSKISDLSPLGWLTSWFLIVLLYVSIIYPLILKVFHLVTNRSLCIIILIEAILALLSSHFLTSTYLSLEKIPVAILFYTIGYVFKEKNLKVYLLRIVDKLWMLVLPLLVLFATVNKPVCMYLNDYGNFFIFVVTSILGITICFWIAEYFKMNEVLNVFGRNSIILYSTHFFVVKIFRLVINFMLVDPFTTIDYPYYFLLFLCVIISEIIILKVWNILKIMMQKKLD